jgi:hypothetical protein
LAAARGTKKHFKSLISTNKQRKIALKSLIHYTYKGFFEIKMESNNNSNTSNPEPPEPLVIAPTNIAQVTDNDLLAHAVPAIIDTSTASVATNPKSIQNDESMSMRNKIGAWYHSNDSYTGLCNNLEK